MRSYLMLQSLMRSCRVFQLSQGIMWVMDYVFKFTSFGWVSLLHGDFFIRQVRHEKLGNIPSRKLHHHLSPPAHCRLTLYDLVYV